jgi:hypothetical protein
MMTTGKVFSTVTDFNFCELPQINEYGGTGSYYDANFLLNDDSGGGNELLMH